MGQGKFFVQIDGSTIYIITVPMPNTGKMSEKLFLQENDFRDNVIIPHICHGLTDDVRGKKICHVEKFQIPVHDRCGEV